MNGMSRILEQASRFVEQQLPPEAIQPVVPAAILLIIAGVLVGVLGARLIRPGLTAIFGIGGALAGGQCAHATGLPMPVTVIISGLVAGGIGYALYRLWVGVGAAMVLAGIAVSVFAYQRIAPEVETFESSGVTAAVGDEAAKFAVLDPDEQQDYLTHSPEKWARQFWTHLTGRQSGIGRRLAAIAGAGGLLGLLLGVILTRPTLILYTSFVGTSLVAGGLAVLAARLDVELYRSALASPGLLTGAMASLLLTSLVLQARLYRPPPASPPSQPKP
jgi:hypothetical protein